jgi:hypothetical protein
MGGSHGGGDGVSRGGVEKSGRVARESRCRDVKLSLM